MMKLIVSGPDKFTELDFMTLMLNRLTFQYDDVSLIAAQKPDNEHLSIFQCASDWYENKWKRGWKGYRLLRRHYPLYSGKKKWSDGMKQMRMEMIEECTHVVAFWDVGGNDFHTEELIRLAKIFDRKLKVFKV